MSESPLPSSAPTPAFPLIARASNTVRNKNLLIVVMCLVFAVWFAYDGWVGWPARNDRLVAGMAEEPKMKDEDRPAIAAWPGFAAASTAQRQHMADVAKSYGRSEFKTDTDIFTQKLIVAGLTIASLGSIGWFVHCQKRRAIAQPTFVSPSPGIDIPWEKITVVDNARWKKSGIVDITYDLGNGPQKAKFDDYELDREPLLLILDQVAERATHAEVLPKEDPAPSDNAPEATEARS